MTKRRGSETADFEVVFDQRRWFRNRIGIWFEKLPLMLKARPPCENAADIQPFAFHMRKHVRRIDSDGWKLIVGAARCVNVMIARIKAEGLRIDPPLQIEFQLRRLIGDFDRPRLNLILRPATRLNGEFSRRQKNFAAVGAIDLLLKKQIRREPLTLGWVDSASFILKNQTRGRRFSIVI